MAHGDPDAPPLLAHEWKRRGVGAFRGNTLPTEDGFYLVDAGDSKFGYESGVVEVKTHQNAGKPWLWVYRVPSRRGQRTHGNPLKFWVGCEWTGPLHIPSAGKQK